MAHSRLSDLSVTYSPLGMGTAGTVSYVEFLLLFVLPPLVVLLAVTALREDGWRAIRPRGVAVIVVIALVYTAPWDNYLITRGVWEYGEGTVAMFLGRAPLEEYLFILLQPVLAALWLGVVRGDSRSMSLSIPTATRLTGVLVALAIGLGGAMALLGTSTFYIGAILTWSAPVLALQWAVGWPYLWRHRRTVATGVLVPSLYFSIADWFAIDRGIWILSEQYTTGVGIFGLPIEEAVFFLSTNLFVIQGLVLFEWVVDRWR